MGGALALVALVVAVQDLWADLRVWAQAALLAVLTALLGAAGAAVRSSADAAVERLAGVLWVLSSAALAFLAAVVAGDGLGWGESAVVTAVGLTTTAYAAVLWRLRPRSLQQVVMAAALVTSVLGILGLRGGLVEPAYGALVVWALGVIWMLLTWGGLVRPPRTGYVVGGTVALVAVEVAAEGGLGGWGHATGLVTSASMIAASVALSQVVLLALGAVGAFVFVAQTVVRYVGDAVGVPLTLFIVGLALVGVAVVIARIRPEVVERGRG